MRLSGGEEWGGTYPSLVAFSSGYEEDPVFSYDGSESDQCVWLSDCGGGAMVAVIDNVDDPI